MSHLPRPWRTDAFTLHHAQDALPLVMDSPHSSPHFPLDFKAALPLEDLRVGEDVLIAEFARTSIDPNRHIYDRKLSVDEVHQRIVRYALPYQYKLKTLIENKHAQFGVCYHINCHSMNAVSGKMGEGGAGIAASKSNDAQHAP